MVCKTDPPSFYLAQENPPVPQELAPAAPSAPPLPVSRLEGADISFFTFLDWQLGQHTLLFEDITNSSKTF
jgi:hypothetical protein